VLTAWQEFKITGYSYKKTKTFTYTLTFRAKTRSCGKGTRTSKRPPSRNRQKEKGNPRAKIRSLSAPKHTQRNLTSTWKKYAL